MIKKHKKYVRPKQIFERERIDEEDKLVKKFGLKNKTEIWKTQAKVDYFRGRAKDLAKQPPEEQEVFFNKLRALGLKIEGTADVLDLKVENLLERRLPTVLVKKKLANAVKQGRQFVTHKKVLINGTAINSPSYLVPLSEEGQIKIKTKVKKAKPKAKAEKALTAEAPKEESLSSPQGGAPQQSEEAHSKSETENNNAPAEKPTEEKAEAPKEVKEETKIEESKPEEAKE
jgi:small subunit ribosomal protein S4